MGRLSHDFYVQPMNKVYNEAIAMYLIWTVLMILLRGRARKAVGIIGAVLSVVLVVSFTIHGRNSKAETNISLAPFISFVKAKTQPEFYRSMFMNMLLFLPLGLSLPFALSKTEKHCVLISIASGFLLSAGVEVVQYFFSLGCCETDDVIMNTLGVIIGSTSFLLCVMADMLFEAVNTKIKK